MAFRFGGKGGIVYRRDLWNPLFARQYLDHRPLCYVHRKECGQLDAGDFEVRL